jgi:ketosteroid isomerase-like protein
MTMGSKHLFVKPKPLSHRLLKWGIPLLLLVILWPSMQTSVHDAIDTWTAPIEPPGAIVVSPNNPSTPAATAQNLPPAERTTAEDNPAATTNTPAQTDTAALASAASTALPPKTEPPDEAGLRSALEQWSQAWQTRDLPAYLALYGPDFVPPQGISRQVWADTRKARISSKQKIELSLQNLSVQMQGTTATVKFTQAYADERFRMTDRKTMVWQQADGRWLIQSETTD